MLQSSYKYFGKWDILNSREIGQRLAQLRTQPEPDHHANDS